MSKKVVPVKWDFRDVSSGIQKLRQFLLGRKYVFHNRWPPLISPRSIPPPDVPRGPDYKYSDQWYGKRDALNSVRPPVVAPVGQGVPPRKQAAMKGKGPGPCYMNLKKTAGADSLEFPCPPTPGMAWWFDGHCYFKTVPDVCRPPPPPPSPPAPPCPPPCPPPVKPKAPCPLEKEPPCPPVKLSASNPCGGDEKPPLSPCKKKPEPCPPPPPLDPCDPCNPCGGKGDKKNLEGFLKTEDQGPKKC